MNQKKPIRKAPLKNKMATDLDSATKYDLYIKAVQSPATDVIFYKKIYQAIRGKLKSDLTLREDFCGTGTISAEWIKLNKNYKSVGLDLDPEPMDYGRQRFIKTLKPEQQKRISLLQKNVLDKDLPKSDIVAAVNFSYCLFKQRDLLKKYFQNVYNSLKPGGIYIIDCFGGSQCFDEIIDHTKHKDFTYYWDQKGFDPLTSYAHFAIHFRYKNKMYKDVFTYDWRLWSIPEIREIMIEVGFQSTNIYWEGTTKKGEGDGIFSLVKVGEACESWIAYVAGVK